jgi:hypothetical protein
MYFSAPVSGKQNPPRMYVSLTNGGFPQKNRKQYRNEEITVLKKSKISSL